MIVSYTRVSTEKQLNGIEQQHNDIQRYIDYKGGQIQKSFTDFGCSGGNDDREQFQEMMKMVKKGLITEIIITELSRWGRNLGDCIKNLDILKKHKVNLICLKENIDLSSPSGTLLSNLLMVVMSWERQQTGERVKSILNDKRLRNKQYTKQKYGYDMIDGRVVENPTEIRLLKKVAKMKCKGKSYQEIVDFTKRNGYTKKNGTDFNRNDIIQMLKKRLNYKSFMTINQVIQYI